MVTTDDRGFVKYWQINFNNVHTFQAHSEPVRSSRCGLMKLINSITPDTSYTVVVNVYPSNYCLSLRLMNGNCLHTRTIVVTLRNTWD